MVHISRGLQESYYQQQNHRLWPITIPVNQRNGAGYWRSTWCEIGCNRNKRRRCSPPAWRTSHRWKYEQKQSIDTAYEERLGMCDKNSRRQYRKTDDSSTVENCSSTVVWLVGVLFYWWRCCRRSLYWHCFL